MEKKVRNLAAKLRRKLPNLDEHDSLLFARSLAATPDQRWEMNVRFVRLLASARPWPAKRSAFK